MLFSHRGDYSHLKSIRAQALGTTIILTLMAGTASAADLTWDLGGATDDWNTTDLNWNPGGIAFTSGVDSAIFSEIGGETVTLTEAITALNVTFQTNGYTIAGANTLTVTGNIDVNGGITGTISAALGGDANATGAGTLNLSGGVGNNLNVTGTGTVNVSSNVGGNLDSDAGTTVVAGGGTITGTTSIDNSEVNVTGGTLTGATTVNGGGTLDVDSGTVGAVTNNGGTVELDGGSVASLDNNTGTTTIANTGDVVGTVTNTADLNINGGSMDTLDNNAGGDVDVGGNATVDTAVTNAAALDINTGTLTVTGDSFTNENGGILTVDNLATLDSNTTNQNGGVINVDGTIDGTLDNQTGGQTDIASTGDVTGNVTNAGDLNINGGSMNGLDNNTGGDVDVTGGGTVDTTVTNAGTLDINTGTLTVTGNSTTNENGGILTVDSGATLASNTTNNAGGTVNLNGTLTGDLTNDGTATQASTGSISGTLDNNATFNANGGTLNNVDNDGTFVMNGDQTVGGTFSNGGTLDATAAGAETLTVSGGTFTAETGSNITSNGAANPLTITSTDIVIQNGAQFNGTNDLDGSVVLNGAIQNAANLDVTAGQTLAGTLTNTGTLNVGATVDAASNNITNTGGTINVDAGGSITNGGALTNQGGGTVAVDATTTATVASTNNTGAGSTVTVDGTLASPTVTNQAGAQMIVNSTGDVQGTITNTADLDINGGTVDAIDNNTGGDVDVTGGGTVDTTVTNAGAFDINTGTLTVTGNSFTNESGGTATIAGGAALASNATNNAGGTFNVNGALTGDFTNDGTATQASTGSISGTLDNNATFNANGGTLNIVDNSGTFDLNGNQTIGGAFTNTGTTEIAAGETLTVAAGVTNTGGTLNLEGTVAGNVTGGTITTTGGAGTITGDLTLAGGTVNLQNDALGGQLTVNGNADLTGTLNYDVNLATGAGAGDVIDVTNTVSGNATFSFDFDFPGSTIPPEDNAPITLLTYGAGTLGITTDGSLPAFGTFSYFLNDTGPGAGNGILLESQLNAGIGTLGAVVGQTQSLIGTVVNRPTSPYVADLAVDAGENPCGFGGWTRLTGGQADATGSYSQSGSSFTTEAPLSMSYGGLQIGGDLACFDGRANGWDLAYGAILGVNQGKVDSISRAFDAFGNPTGPIENIVDTDFTQTYAGAYLTAGRDRLFADLLFRLEDTKYDPTNTDFNDPTIGNFDFLGSFKSKGQTLSGAVGYSWPIGDRDGLNFISTAGFSVTKTQTDTVNLFNNATGNNESLAFADHTQKVAFVSGTVSNTRLRADEVSLISYFGTGTYYFDFSSDRQATFTTPTQTSTINLSPIGNYGEVSAGLNFVRILSPGQFGASRQLNAAVRVDARFGSNVESVGITGQLRLQF